MKYILYCRKSSESEDRQVMSLDAQEVELTNLAKRNGVTIVKVLRESKSAKEPGRPLFAEMLKLIGQGKADGILCWKLDRLARNPVDGGSISWMLQQNQIHNIKTHERDYFPSDNVLLMSVEFGMSNQYVRDLSENVKRGNREKLRRGEWPNKAPFGYLNDRNTKSIIVDPVRGKAVQRIFELYIEGHMSYGAVADVLYKEGLRTQTGGKVLKSHVARVLNDSFYFGLMRRGGDYFKGNHPPLISKEIFEKAQVIRTGMARPKEQTLTFAYRGLMTCAECNCMLTASRKKSRYDYYYCTNGKSVCNQHLKYLNETETNKLFLQALEEIHFDEEIIEIMYQGARQMLQNGQENVESRILDIEHEIELVALRERKLLHIFTSDLIQENLYVEQAQKLKQERDSLESSKRNLISKDTDPYATLELVKSVFLKANKALFAFKTAEPQEKSEMVKDLLWNLGVKDKNAAYFKFKSPYDAIAKAPKNGDLTTLLPVRDSNPNNILQRDVSYH